MSSAIRSEFSAHEALSCPRNQHQGRGPDCALHPRGEPLFWNSSVASFAIGWALVIACWAVTLCLAGVW